VVTLRTLGRFNDIHPEAEIGEGTIIYSWNYIGNCKIGKRNKITNWVHIGDGCEIGDDCNFQPKVVLNGGMKVGDRVFFAGNVGFYDMKYVDIAPIPPERKEPVMIGNDAVFGNDSTIGAGVTIGEGAVIAACSLVTKDVPPREVWLGKPAKYLMSRERYDDLMMKRYRS
jgi:acetyltransferase-like isoleucine patch superfamily enzyme